MRHRIQALALVLIVGLTTLATGPSIQAATQAAQAQVTVQGEVKSPGTVVWSDALTVQAVLDATGGATEKFSLARSYITRSVVDKDGKVTATAKIKALKTTTRILPGDIVVAGRKWM